MKMNLLRRISRLRKVEQQVAERVSIGMMEAEDIAVVERKDARDNLDNQIRESKNLSDVSILLPNGGYLQHLKQVLGRTEQQLSSCVRQTATASDSLCASRVSSRTVEVVLKSDIARQARVLQALDQRQLDEFASEATCSSRSECQSGDLLNL